MNVSIDVSWKSLNKHDEELCGDKVEILKTEDSDIVILADGIGQQAEKYIPKTIQRHIQWKVLLKILFLKTMSLHCRGLSLHTILGLKRKTSSF